jgi:hypothetical protein
MIGAIIAYAAFAASMHSSVWLGVGTICHVTAAEIVKNRGMWFKIGEKNLVLFPIHQICELDTGISRIRYKARSHHET